MPEAERKDRLVQTRVPEGLDETLREAARKSRVSVSQLIRNVLESTFDLVDNVVTHTTGLTADVKRDARRIADSATGRKTLAKVYAWQDVVINRDTSCSNCKRHLAKGQRGMIGLQDDATAAKLWLCPTCAGAL